MKRINGIVVLFILMVCFFAYGAIGTCGNVDEIKERAPIEIEKRNWEIMRAEGWQFGSYSSHGGKVWYHVRNVDNHDIQYRVYVTLWGGDLHFMYGAPEKINRVNIDTTGLSNLLTGGS